MKTNKSKKHKSYSLQAKYGIKGESYFESLIVEYALPHHIVGSKDLGIDYICEWVHGDNPTGILFAVQVKTFRISKKRKPKLVNDSSDNNKLEEYKIVNPNFKINAETLEYWKRLGIPVYLFAITLDDKANCLDCYYKRFTPMLTEDNMDLEPSEFYSEFYKANDNNKFLAFKYFKDRIGGFTRDLFIDYIRCNYYKGTFAYLNPRDIGLNEFPEKDAIFKELVEKYKIKLLDTCSKMLSLMIKNPGIFTLPDVSSSCIGTTTECATYTPGLNDNDNDDGWDS